MTIKMYGRGFWGMAFANDWHKTKTILSSDFALAGIGQFDFWFRQGLGEKSLPVGKRRKLPSLSLGLCLILP